MAGSGGSEDSDDLSHLARPVETEERRLAANKQIKETSATGTHSLTYI